MRWGPLFVLLIGTAALAQSGSPPNETGTAPPGSPPALLPDSPGSALLPPPPPPRPLYDPQTQSSSQTPGQSVSPDTAPDPCPIADTIVLSTPEDAASTQTSAQTSTQRSAQTSAQRSTPALARPCLPGPNPYKRFLSTSQIIPLTPQQKGFLALHDLLDPFTLLTVAGNSAVTIGVDSHSAYGPGMRGFGKNVGISMLQDATGETIGTFAVCSLFHEDPHYHRMPGANPFRRIVHAVSRTLIAHHDDGSPMLNMENLITYPATAEISNLYVPGIQTNLPSTVKRVLTGLAFDPIGNLITEFIPDFASHVHIRILFVQQILNKVASGEQL